MGTNISRGSGRRRSAPPSESPTHNFCKICGRDSPMSQPELSVPPRIRARRSEGEGRWDPTTDEEYRDRNPLLKENTIAGLQLQPKEVDYHLEINHKNHNTTKYPKHPRNPELTENENKNDIGGLLIVRRGQTFDLTILFDRAYDPENDQITLDLATGTRPDQSKGTLLRLRDSTETAPWSWGMQITRVDGDRVSMQVTSPADAAIGRYELLVETELKDPKPDGELKRKKFKDIIVLFNAWCKDDAVYMEDQSHREEYVLNDYGRIWVGHWSNSRPWKFGQFEAVSLETALKLLDNLNGDARRIPKEVCRRVSQMVNSNDEDGGILEGRWAEEYPDGTFPWTWTGSVKILEEYARKNSTVKYGQCWVFSGVVTTLSRALGIPTRSVTNFDSAHDTDGSLTIDTHFDEEGEPIALLNSDSNWNYHVWNESYFSRPDLPAAEFSGWQAYDATPQERSDGIFRCGPCPLTAVKNGDVHIPHDTGFVFAEVNGDRCYWMVYENGHKELINVQKEVFGTNISTKAVGSNEREDITELYKHKEGSPEERKAVERALRARGQHDYPSIVKPKDVTFSYEVQSDVVIGSDFYVIVKANNKGSEKRSVDISITVKSAMYTGRNTHDVAKLLRQRVELEPNHPYMPDKEIQLIVKAQDYVTQDRMLDDEFLIYFHSEVHPPSNDSADASSTSYARGHMETVVLTMPELQQKQNEVYHKVDEDFEVEFFFVNPLPIPLTGICFQLDCKDLTPGELTRKLESPVQPNEKASILVTFKSIKKGTKEVDVTVTTDQISEFDKLFYQFIRSS
ncbi:protein-glutamine gamma-glutamyltransferase 4 isoform X2 [Nematostella vectensis]|uniref:protein-glutamine gamma-glutamyltransferase 4 isoform X2 n=1 Tax=Nematostella vectensis TaxID=45351 RepID=UPI0020772A6B|nr:protein-glutamine gamma-glutamyltransferase 4 isoform X2 [Nematostella vectensis]